MDTCPFCGAKKLSPYIPYTLEFRCGTTGIQHLSQITCVRSSYCYETELTQTRERLAVAEAELAEGKEVNNAEDKCEMTCLECNNKFSVCNGDEEVNWKCPVCTQATVYETELTQTRERLAVAEKPWHSLINIDWS